MLKHQLRRSLSPSGDALQNIHNGWKSTTPYSNFPRDDALPRDVVEDETVKYK